MRRQTIVRGMTLGAGFVFAGGIVRFFTGDHLLAYVDWSVALLVLVTGFMTKESN